jgi:IrrE N-terminal-like domain
MAEQKELDLLGNSTVGPIDTESTRRALDELFRLTHQYNSTKAYDDLLKFMARFRFYAPYNAMLIHIQMPGAKFVASPHRWLQNYRQRIKPGARPLVILQPMGPVMFVFDVSDTEPLPDAPPLPPEVTSPFEVRGGTIGNELERTIENAKRDGVRVSLRSAGSQSAGQIGTATTTASLEVVVRLAPKAESVRVPVRYELLLNSEHSREVRYATLAHELAHLYCGHLGTPNARWWPDRSHLSVTVREFEAESVCYLACRRRGIDNPSEKYLAGYVEHNSDVPKISLECVMTAAGMIEKMGHERLKPRKEGGSPD